MTLLMMRQKPVFAIDLPEDRVSTAYHFFDGGGITVQGPSLIVRKAIKGKTAIEAGSRIDMVSSASIDVVTQASPYSEERHEHHVGISHIFKETLVSSTYTLSDEPDYRSNNLSLALSHDLLESKLSLDLRFSRSRDQVGKNSDPAFGEKAIDSSTYAIGLTRLLSSRALLQVNYELSTARGQLSNPYRSALTGSGDLGALVPEHYPAVRTGQAWLIRGGFALPGTETGRLRDSIQLDYRYYRDTFGLRAHTGKMQYQHLLSGNWRFGLFYRYYTQDAATFYGDRVPANQRFKARDKELSTFSDQTVGGSIHFEPDQKRWGLMIKPYFKTSYSFIFFDYDDFTDPRDGRLFSWEANVIQASFGFNY